MIGFTVLKVFNPVSLSLFIIIYSIYYASDVNDMPLLLVQGQLYRSL